MGQRNRSRVLFSERRSRPGTSQQALRDSSDSNDSNDNNDLNQLSQNDSRGNERNMRVLVVSKYILALTWKKLPIRVSDVVKTCLHGENRLFPEILSVVSNQLADIYGLEVHEIHDEKLGKIILCTSSVAAGSQYDYKKEQRVEMRLLFIVLSYIHMKGETVAETALLGFLKRLGMHDEPHEIFGNFKKKITETFVRQFYLKREIVELEGNAENRIQYSWGRRAQLELSTETVIQAVAKILQVPASALAAQNGDENTEEDDEMVTSDIEINDE